MGRMPGICPAKDLPRLIYHRRALSKELLLRAVTGTSFFTTGGESRIQCFSETRRAAPSLCDGSVDSRAIVLKTRLSFLKPHTVHIFCEHLSPRDESACHPKPKYLRQVERNPCDAGATTWALLRPQRLDHIHSRGPRRRHHRRDHCDGDQYNCRQHHG
jgi:hypothetical protein